MENEVPFNILTHGDNGQLVPMQKTLTALRMWGTRGYSGPMIQLRWDNERPRDSWRLHIGYLPYGRHHRIEVSLLGPDKEELRLLFNPKTLVIEGVGAFNGQWQCVGPKRINFKKR